MARDPIQVLVVADGAAFFQASNETEEDWSGITFYASVARGLPSRSVQTLTARRLPVTTT